MKKPGLIAYEKASTPVAKSQEDIRRLLTKYGAKGLQCTEDWERLEIAIRFIFPVDGRDFIVVLKAPIPQAEAQSPTGRERTDKARQALQEQYERGVWRAVFHAIKSRLESVAFGFETFEQAFLAHIEFNHAGNTIGDVIIPHLDNLREAGRILLEHKP